MSSTYNFNNNSGLFNNVVTYPKDPHDYEWWKNECPDFFDTKKYDLFYKLSYARPKSYPEINSILDSVNFNDIYLSSDLHFSSPVHPNDNIKIQNNNKIIDNNKVLIYLGDLGYKFNSNIEYLQKCAQQLNKGKYSIFVCGNHDIYEEEFYTKVCGFSIYIETGFIWKNFVFTHIPLMDINNPNKLINVHGHTHENEIIAHIGKKIYDNKHHDEYNNFYGKSYKYNNRIRIYTEINNFYPISLARAYLDYLKNIKQKEIKEV